MRATDLPRAEELRQIAGWNQRVQDWHRFLDLSPQGCFVAEISGRIVGTVTTVQYGKSVGWIGMLLVLPEVRNQGIGKSLLTHAIDYLQSEEAKSIKLDATPLGEPLYRKLGFQDEWRLTRYKGLVKSTFVPAGEIVQLRKDTAEQMTVLDAEAFGIRRPELINSLLAMSQNAVGVCTGDELDAFGLLRPGSVANYIGPIVARSNLTAAKIIGALSKHAGARLCYWDIPEPNEAALRLAERMGFTPERPLLRMRLGRNDSPGDVSKYFAIADPSLG